MSPNTNVSIGNASKSRFLILIVILLAIITALVSYLTYAIVRDNKTSNTLRKVETKADVLYVYGDFFKTQTKQQEIENKIFEDPETLMKTPVLKTIDPRYFLSVCQRESSDQPDDSSRPTGHEVPNISPKVDFRKKRRRRGNNGPVEEDGRMYHYHGCCVSLRKFISPENAISDHNGRRVNLVHFGNDERQYFLVDICHHEAGCILNCQCRHQVGLFRALVHNPTFDRNSDEPRYLVNTIRLKGNCKCMNNKFPF